MPTRRVLITGLSTYWGGRLAQALEQDERVEAIIGVDNRDPTRELDRTEFVRVGTQHALLRRIVEAAEIDTVVDSRLVVDSVTTSARRAHENNVIGTMNILAASSHSTVRRFVFKSSAHYYGTAQDDPAFFTESMPRPHSPSTPIEKDIVEAEASVRDFAEKNPQVTTTIMRFANVLGPDVRTSHTTLFSLPVVPTILGFDPRYQFVHEDDVVVALAHTVQEGLPGIYNVAADGVLALTEVIDLLGRRWAPLLPPWGTGAAASVLRRLGLRIPPEMLGQLRFGRGLDNRNLKATGFEYRYTTRETVLALAEHLRLHPILRGVREPYRYEREVEDFLRWSPHVSNPAYRSRTGLSPEETVELRRLHESYGERVGAPQAGTALAQAEALARAAGGTETPAPVERYDDLDPEDVVSLLGSLESADLLALRDHERARLRRPRVLAAIDGVLAQREAAPRT
ncbi:MAG: NAD-dependent epimerase/dehydratase family protein [Actinobacteria bacterium]|nr:MAG: NAD-dependent epimerase/dehydratase family protein [Actinomycetota bacterium]TMM11154.1 MAG: NAD-dependent epimerase/dehydratase family protein [Actinomycetota bacterium]